MATEILTLGAVNSRRESPYRDIVYELAGDDTLEIEGGYNFEVPCVWELVSAYLSLATDATVANRVVVYYLASRPGYPFFYGTSDNITASSSNQMVISRFAVNSTMLTVIEQYLGIQPAAFTISGTNYVHFSVTSGVAGDLLSLRLQFRYKNWELGMKEPAILDQRTVKRGCC